MEKQHSKFVIVRLTPEQYALICKVAKAFGKPLSTTIREAALSGLVNKATLAIVSKNELAEALNVDLAVVDYLLKKEAPSEPAPGT